MLRSLLMGVLALSTASACKGSPDAPAVQAGVTAGTVLEVSGTVTAMRGTEKRAITAQQDVSGDDVIDTGADGRVRIRIAHNAATWELGPNRKEMVGKSLAWKLPKQAAPASEVNEATLAAGRHAERETVTTTNTAPAPATAAPGAPAPGAAPSSDQAAAASDEAMPERKAAPVKAATRARDKGMASPPPPPPTGGAMAGEGGGAARGGDLAQEKSAAQAPKDSPKPAITRGKITESSELDDSVSDKEMIAPEVLVKKRIAEERATLTACMETNTLAVEVAIVKGVATFVLPAGTPEKVKTCFEQAATKIRFPTDYTLRVKTSLMK